MTSDLERALAYLVARFPLDDRQRMQLGPASETPRFALARTGDGCIWRFRSDLVPDQLRALSKYAAREPAVSNPAAAPPPERLEPMRRVLFDEHGEASVTRLLLCFKWQAAPGEEPPAKQPEAADCADSGAGVFLEFADQIAVFWGDAEALAEMERRALCVYGDLLLID